MKFLSSVLSLLVGFTLTISQAGYFNVPLVDECGVCMPDGGYVLEDNRDGVYNYCPSVLVEDSAGLFYCSNSESYVVRDSVYYRELRDAYKPKEVLTSTEGSWDSVHVCDPSVISGDWVYNGEHYRYLMAYLGCSSLDNQQNQIGLAVSNSKSSDWIKVGLEPFIGCNYDNSKKDYFQWGVGQPSLINCGEGIVAVFYTEGTWNLTCTKCALYDLSDLNNIQYFDSATVSNSGLLQLDGISQDFLSNGDFALSGSTLYVVCDTHPFGNGVLSCVPEVSKIYCTTIDISCFLSSLENCEWELLYEVSEGDKSHNNGLFRDERGYLFDGYVVTTVGYERSNFPSSLFTYRMKVVEFE